MTIVDVIGFAAFLTNVAGNFMLVYKTVWGWVVRLVSISLWFVYGWGDDSLPNVANAVVFFFINCYGIYRWRKEHLVERTKA